jgi:5-methylcytosine-specific restriction endonuclease McrA
MSEYNPKFPDWSSIWQQELARRKAAAKYSAMPEDQRKARNQKLWHNRMASPEQAAKYKEKARKWRESNKAARRDYDRKWKEQNPERYKELTSRARKKRSAKPEVRIVSNFRKRLREIMSDARNGGKQSTLKLIGCSSSELAAHLESQFKRGMTWGNYGTHWHVDHIIPCAAFDHTKPEQVRQCWHFTNLRPLEAKVNLAKGAKIQAPQLQLLLTH